MNKLPLVLGYLIIYCQGYLDQETVKEPFRSSSQAATCYYLQTIKVRKSH